MANTLTFLSYNLNGIRAALKKNWLEWFLAHQIDVVGIQETKARPEQVDLTALAEAGYPYQYWHSAEKKGYSGVAIFSRIKPDLVQEGIGVDWVDAEGRVLRADFGEVTLLNCYFPSGTSGEVRQEVKYRFLDAIDAHVATLRQTRPHLIVQGDYNIAHTEMDLHNPKNSKKSSGFLPEERAWMSEWFATGKFVDSFRQMHPDVQKYSWWTYRMGARGKNKGWRLDYQAVTPSLQRRICQAELLNDAVHSDHCPCLLKLDVTDL